MLELMLPTLSVAVENFPNGIANGATSVSISSMRFMKFAMSTGMPIFAAATAVPGVPVALAAYKALAAKCAIDFSKPNLSMAAGYAAMDATEQANISYWTGMTVAAVIADTVLGVPRLLHAAAYAGLTRTNPTSRRLADLVGQDQDGRWHVIEAKGRKSVSKADRQRWKAQASSISHIDGYVPFTRSYSVTHIAETYTADIVDPPFGDRAAMAIELSPEELLDRYYGPVLTWVAQGGRRISRGGTPLVVRLAAYDADDSAYVWVGVAQSVLERKAGLVPESEPIDSDDGFVGSDGIAVVTTRRNQIQ